LGESRVGDQEVHCVLFESAGPQNTERTLALAMQRVRTLGLCDIVVASTTGDTGARAAELFQGLNVVVVTHSTGFKEPNTQELLPENRERILAFGGHVLTCQHAFGGLARAVRRKLGTYELDEIVAFVLRMFGQGIKVACEITAMAADAGLVPTGAEIIAIGGTGRGADTAAVIRAANAQDLFDLRVLEVLCKPRL